MSPNQKIALVLAEKIVDLLEDSGASRDEQATALAVARELVSLSSASLTCLPQLTGGVPEPPVEGSR